MRAILKARKLGILTPAVYFAEPEASTIYMEKLDARMLKDLLVPKALSSEGKHFLTCVWRNLRQKRRIAQHFLLLQGILCSTDSEICADLNALLKNVGRAVAVLHDGSLVHGDLTTSNVLVRNEDQAVVRCACILL